MAPRGKGAAGSAAIERKARRVPGSSLRRSAALQKRPEIGTAASGGWRHVQQRNANTHRSRVLHLLGPFALAHSSLAHSSRAAPAWSPQPRMGVSRRALALLFAVLAIVFAMPWSPWGSRSSAGTGECPLVRRRRHRPPPLAPPTCLACCCPQVSVYVHSEIILYACRGLAAAAARASPRLTI